METFKKHGFTTREAWKTAFDSYFTKIRELDDCNYKILNTSENCDDWIYDFKKQSRIIRSMYLKNDVFKQEHVYYFTKHPQHWTKAVADSLLAYVYRYWAKMEDVESIYEAATSLLKYYESQQDEIAIMKCKLVLAYCYIYLDNVHNSERSLQLCYEVNALLKKHYDALSEEDRSMAMSVYDFRYTIRHDTLCITKDFAVFLDEVLYPEYKETITMLERFVQDADMTLPINAVLPYMIRNCKRNFAEICLRIHKDTLRDDQLKMLQAIADELLEQKDDINSQVEHMICHYMAHRFSLPYTNEELVTIFMDAVQVLVVIDNATKQEDVKQLMETMESFSSALQTLGEETPECIYQTTPICRNYLHYLLKLPYSQGMIQQIDQTIYSFVIPLMKYIENVDEVFNMLMEITIFRQIQTAIHSRMVGKSACMILSYVIDDAPDLLIGIPGLKNGKEIKAKKESILQFMQQAAMVHDVGKILCTRVINMQYRKITDIEFATIRFHPESSDTILSSIPSMHFYRDMAVGHHKSFDGKFGYPKNFDNLHSKQKLFIDLIRICDSLDAATDTFGRLYAEPKTFVTVLEEFKLLKGTSYSDVLVDFICNHEKLQQELSELMEHGRECVYREMYQIIKKQNEEGDLWK